jgi:hypothetical protein
MGRVHWSLVLAGTFVLGVIVGHQIRLWPSATEEQTVVRLRHEVSALQARLQAAENSRRSGSPGSGDPARPGFSRDYRAPDRLAATAVVEDPAVVERLRPGTSTGSGAAQPDGGASRVSTGVAATAPTVEAALDRFRQYLDALQMPEGRERGQRLRELLNELRGMGDTAGRALMEVLASGTDSDERRAAARLLGTLQVPGALPLLQNVLQREDDVLLRRAAAAGLRQLQTPESVPVMERLLANPAEDRMVRLSVAYGLAESGKPTGVAGLARIFEESTADGRGRALAFRALASLNDERPLPFMRQLVTSEAEPAYRLQAIKYVASQGDQQALPALQAVMHATNEQASVRDAAAQAYRTLSSR